MGVAHRSIREVSCSRCWAVKAVPWAPGQIALAALVATVGAVVIAVPGFVLSYVLDHRSLLAGEASIDDVSAT